MCVMSSLSGLGPGVSHLAKGTPAGWSSRLGPSGCQLLPRGHDQKACLGIPRNLLFKPVHL